MNYLESITYIDNLHRDTGKLERMQAFLREHNRLPESYASLHVGGTNGKGSTAAILEAILLQMSKFTKIKVGKFIGPHILRHNERFHIDGSPITDDEFTQLATRIKILSEDFTRRYPLLGPLSWFEFLTAIAFFYFAENNIDVAVLEVGLGGMWDSTNVVKSPLASAIVSVDFDHMKILGKTIVEIAQDKAGIIKGNCPVVTGTSDEALSVILNKASELDSTVYQCSNAGKLNVYPSKSNSEVNDVVLSQNLEELFNEIEHNLSLVGQHQKLNATIAICIILVSGLTNKYACDFKTAINKAFSTLYWPARFQYLPSYKLVLDAAHNPAGAVELRNTLNEVFPDKKFIFVLGSYSNKDITQFMNSLLKFGDSVLACEASSTRPVHLANEIVEMAKLKGNTALALTTVNSAFEQAQKICKEDQIIVATGSFAIVRECMLALGWSKVEDGIPATFMNWTRSEAVAS